MSNFFIIEGGEGVGKTTQCMRLSSWLKSQGLETKVVSELRTIPENQAISQLILDPESEFEPLTEALLITAARSQAYVHIGEALARGEIVISDRGPLSSLVYQSLIGGVPKSVVQELNRLVIRSLEAFNIVIDCPVEICHNRRAARIASKDKFEIKPLIFHEQIRLAYLTIADETGATIVDGSGTADSLEMQLRKIFAQRLGLKLP